MHLRCRQFNFFNLKSQLQKSKPKPMKEIMKFRRATEPQAYPLRYVEDSGAKYDFIRPSSLKGCLPVRRTQTGGSIGCMLHISARGKTARVLPLPEIFASPPMASATARFMTFASGSYGKYICWICFNRGRRRYRNRNRGMGRIFDPDPNSDPETDLSACPHRQVNPNNCNFYESGILKLNRKMDRLSGKCRKTFPTGISD